MSMTSCNHMCCHSCHGSRGQFSTKQCSASQGKGYTRLSLHCYYPSFTCPIPRFVSIRSYWDHLGREGGHLISLNELDARLQQIWKEMSQDVIQNLYASMLDRITSCIRTRGLLEINV
ncbi:UNVERIFIED_CONTAM: hypothetical protein NCL1_27171 [Trichonephila clavipes]